MHPSVTAEWLALVIGNTRLHWGLFQSEQLVSVWHTPHLEPDLATYIQQSGFVANAWERVAGLSFSESISRLETRSQPFAPLPKSLWIASVVPAQTAVWASRRAVDNELVDEATSQVQTFLVARSRIPLQNVYLTLGIDRAINLLGAGATFGWPVLVIDAGTAMTFTAGENQSVKGGAILPGLRLQARSLGQKSAALAVDEDWLDQGEGRLIERWAMDTSEAIASGLVYSAIATLQDYLTDWWQHFPDGKAILTGGDGPLLHSWLQQKTPEIASRVIVNSHLMFLGMQSYRQATIRD